jgi:hypothetical protein
MNLRVPGNFAARAHACGARPRLVNGRAMNAGADLRHPEIGAQFVSFNFTIH